MTKKKLLLFIFQFELVLIGDDFSHENIFVTQSKRSLKKLLQIIINHI